jgi:hypothetical protein
MFSTLRQTFGDGDRLLSVEIAPPFHKDRTSMRTACERCRVQKVGRIAAIHHHYLVGDGSLSRYTVETFFFFSLDNYETD